MLRALPSRSALGSACQASDRTPSKKTLLHTPAAIGFNVETVTYKNIKFQVWDLGGQTSIRPYWRCYYPYAVIAC